MTVLDWMLEFRARAMQAGDAARVRLSRLHGSAFGFRETDPDRALAIYEEGRRLAKALNEPWWVLYYDEWRLTAMMHFQRDYSHALDLAVQSTLEIRKSQYDGLPLRHAFHFHLISAYLGVDPRGYAKPAGEALAFLEAEVPQAGETRYLLTAHRRDFALGLGDLEEAERIGLQSLALTDSDPNPNTRIHFGTFAYDALSAVAWLRGDWEALAGRAEVGEEMARKVGHKVELASMQLWGALAAQHVGDMEKARRLYRQSIVGVSRLRMPPEAKYFDALCGYLEADENVEGQLSVRDRELTTLLNKGRIEAESQCRLKRCRLLARLGRPLDEEMAAARAAAGKLRNPAPRLAELDAIERGETGSL